jgi:5-deoxy-5-amino-3-dehydroquinate synthase
VKFTVELDERSYDVVVGEGARRQLAPLLSSRAPRARSVAIVTSPLLATQQWFDLESGREQHVLFVPEGESAKTWASTEDLLERVAALHLSRDDVIVGMGGGAITDLAGFVAAIYLRGVAVVQIPTSLLGQVDAAIGGKTGVNLDSGKNLVGAFHQPLGVLCDAGVLATLPERDRLSGLGEIAKCWLLEGRDAKALSSVSLTDLVELSIGLKVAIVSGDEREGGSRSLLNYGHTLAHALEKLVLRRGPDELRHGEAVAVGLAFAVRLAHELGRVDVREIANHDAVLDHFGLVRRLPKNVNTGEIVGAMAHDKKAHHDLSFVLPGPQGFAVAAGVDPTVVREVLDRFQGEL